MIETRIKVYNGMTVLMDLVAGACAFVAAMLYASAIPYVTGTDGLTYLNLRAFAAMALASVAATVAHIVINVLYFTLRSPFGARNLLLLLLRVMGFVALDCAIILAACWSVKAPLLPLDFFLAYAVVFLAGAIVLRTLVQAFLSWSFTLKDNLINILIVGTNQRAYEFFNYLRSNWFLGYRVIGFVDDNNYCGKEDVNLLAPLSDFTTVAREHVLDSVVLFLPMREYYDKILSIIEDCRTQGIPAQHMYCSLVDQKSVKVSPSSIGGYSGVAIPSGPANTVLLACKRLFDIVFSLAALLASLPVLLVAAAAVKIEDGGPIFFTQSRVGFRKRTFGLLKLRTMVVDAEKLMPKLERLNEMDGPVFKIRNDPRITKVGHVLRKYHIDELPQFVNVLLGDMSVVGPRPMAERDYQGFSEDWLRRRFSARPGITCTWQTLPNRNDIPFNKWMSMDMDYAEHWTFWKDLLIIFRTVLMTLKGTGR